MENNTVKEYLKMYIYYILIGVLSLLSIIVFPILGAAGNDISIIDTFPKDTTG